MRGGTFADVFVYVRNLLHQLFYRLQLRCGRVALHDVSDGLGVLLKALDQVFVGRGHAGDLELGDLRLQAPRLIGQLSDDEVPDREALVAGLAGGELALESPGTLVTAGPRRPLPARALAGGAVALLAGESPRVAVASWGGKRDTVRTGNFRELSEFFFI